MREKILISVLMAIGLTACAEAKQVDEERRDASPQSQTKTPTSSSASSCPNHQIKIVVDELKKSGILELLASIRGMEGSGYTSTAHDLAEGRCIERLYLEKLFKESASSQNANIDILISYDPNGLPEHDGYRSRIDIEPSVDSDEPVSLPPADMKFGEAVWNPSMTDLVIRWYARDDEWFMQFAQPDRPWSASEIAAINRWENLNSTCRGGSGDNPRTMMACDQREAATGRLRQLNICYGKDGQAGYQMEMHRCGRDSTR